MGDYKSQLQMLADVSVWYWVKGALVFLYILISVIVSVAYVVTYQKGDIREATIGKIASVVLVSPALCVIVAGYAACVGVYRAIHRAVIGITSLRFWNYQPFKKAKTYDISKSTGLFGEDNKSENK